MSESIEIATKYLHLGISAFVPYSDIEIACASINIDDKIFAYKENLRLCQPYPNKNYYVVQQRPTYRNRNEEGLLFLTPDPKTDKITVKVDWEWFFTFKPNAIITSTQIIEYTINNFPSDGIIPPNHVMSAGRHNAPVMVFTSGSFDEIDWRMESCNAIPEFFYFEDGKTNNTFIKSLKLQIPLEIYPMEQWQDITDKPPSVFDHWEVKAI